jgi:tetratricopeptide (TPR) repeat protein
LVLAIEAVDENENSIEAKIVLSDIQIRMSYFNDAISTLISLVDIYPQSIKIKEKLILAYIKSFKFTDAQKIIDTLAPTTFGKTGDYASFVALLNFKSENIKGAIEWYRRAINLDPLNEENFYMMAQIFLRFKKFDKSKMMLEKALTLDPLNLDFKILYSKILYEMEGAEVAQGYLEKMLQDNVQIKEIQEKDIPRVLGEIAIIYHKIGQLEKFEKEKKELESKYSGDSNFYEFMVEIAKREDKVDDVIKYSKLLEDRDPGNLEAKILMGEFTGKRKSR